MVGLAIRTLPLLAVIVSFAIALGAYMNFSGVRGAYIELIRSRLEVIASELERDIVSATALNIALPEQVTLDRLLVRLANADPAILSIDVEGPDGTALFSSVEERTGHQNKPDGLSFDINRPLLNDFEAQIGRIVIRYDRTEMSEKIDALANGIVADAVPAGLVAIIAGSMAAFLIMNGLHSRARRMAAAEDEDPIKKATVELSAVEAKV